MRGRASRRLRFHAKGLRTRRGGRKFAGYPAPCVMLINSKRKKNRFLNIIVINAQWITLDREGGRIWRVSFFFFFFWNNIIRTFAGYTVLRTNAITITIITCRNDYIIIFVVHAERSWPGGRGVLGVVRRRSGRHGNIVPINALLGPKWLEIKIILFIDHFRLSKTLGKVPILLRIMTLSKTFFFFCLLQAYSYTSIHCIRYIHIDQSC